MTTNPYQTANVNEGKKRRFKRAKWILWPVAIYLVGGVLLILDSLLGLHWFNDLPAPLRDSLLFVYRPMRWLVWFLDH